MAELSLLAHAGHWLESAAFALPPVLLIGSLVTAAVIARRRERRDGLRSEVGR